MTLEPVPRSVSEPISALYAPPPAEQPVHEVEVLPEGEEAEPLPEDGIDVGEVVAEHLALLLDPYPRTRMRLLCHSPTRRAKTKPRRAFSTTTPTPDPSRRLAN